MKLPEFFAHLDKHCESVPLDRLVQLMTELDITREDFDHAVNYNEDHYCRNVLNVGTGYSALVLCWRNGQGTPVHDHRGSACGVRVLEGVVTETSYRETAGGKMEEKQTVTYEEGHVCGSYDNDIHTIQNMQPGGRDLITLHVYTPPMMNYRMWDLDTGEVKVCKDVETLEAQKRLGLLV